MNKLRTGLFRFSLCLVMAISLGVPARNAAPADSEKNAGGDPWLIPIRGDIGPSMAAFVRRESRKAQDAGAAHIIFEIDTFGGRVDSALQITSFIMSIKNARTVAWVNNRTDAGEASMGVSWSAGALIAFACNDIYMARGTSIGAAAPVTLGPDGKTEATGEKTVAAVRSQMAALAERNNHPVGIALAMVDFDVELWEVSVDGVSRVLTLRELERLGEDSVKRVGIISPPGKLLSLTAGEALNYGLAAGLADDREALLTQLGLTGGLVESSPGAADGIVSLLTSAPVQIVLIILGILMIFLEIQTPGFGIPGVTAIIAFSVVFGSGAMLGRVGSLEIILFLLGLGLLAVELFIIPGFGVVGISGILLIGLSLVFSMQDFVIPRFDWEWSLLGRNAVVVTVGIIAAISGIALIALFGPRLKIFDRLTLTTAITGTAGGAAEAPRNAGEDESPYKSLTGRTGKALSTLRPSGRIEIGGEVYSAETDGSFVEEGREIQVARVQGARIIVRAV